MHSQVIRVKFLRKNLKLWKVSKWWNTNEARMSYEQNGFSPDNLNVK